MDQNRQVDVATLLNTIAGQLAQSQEGLNGLDDQGTHGRRMAEAFRAAASAAEGARTDDAGRQLEVAAEAMRKQGQGKAARFYADGLAESAQEFRGQSGISIGQLLPLLQAFLGGVQRNNPAQPGQGTMIDVLAPAVGALATDQQRGADSHTSILDALSAALGGAQQTQRGQGHVDPGAASAVNIIGGIISALAPSIIGALMNSRQGAQQPDDYSRVPGAGGVPAQGQDPFGGLGGLIGGLFGGQGQGSLGTESGNDLGDLLGEITDGSDRRRYT